MYSKNTFILILRGGFCRDTSREVARHDLASKYHPAYVNEPRLQIGSGEVLQEAITVMAESRGTMG